MSEQSVEPEIVAKLVTLARALADVPRDSALGISGYASEARAIVAELPMQPADSDPDLSVVHEMSRDWLISVSSYEDFEAHTLAAIKRGRALASAPTA